MQSKGEAQSCFAVLFGLFNAPAEAVDDPRLGGLQLAVQCEDFLHGLDAMDDERFAEGFAQTDVFDEDFTLFVEGGSSHLVKPRFPDEKEVFCLFGIFGEGLPPCRIDVPRVDAVAHDGSACNGRLGMCVDVDDGWQGTPHAFVIIEEMERVGNGIIAESSEGIAAQYSIGGQP